MDDTSSILRSIFQFDPENAAKALHRLHEGERARPAPANPKDAVQRIDRETAVVKAHQQLIIYMRMLGPERLSEQRLAAAAAQLDDSLKEFVTASAELMDQVGLTGPRRAKRAPTPPAAGHRDARTAAELAASLQPLIAELRRRWTFSSSGSALPGTQLQRGVPPKGLLAEIELILSLGGFSLAEIARLQLDGEPNRGSLDRVRKRITRRRKGIMTTALDSKSQRVVDNALKALSARTIKGS